MFKKAETSSLNSLLERCLGVSSKSRSVASDLSVSLPSANAGGDSHRFHLCFWLVLKGAPHLRARRGGLALERRWRWKEACFGVGDRLRSHME